MARAPHAGGRRRAEVCTLALPPPVLTGSAATNPRSTFNPLALAYLGDAVWEAHTRRLEVLSESGQPFAAAPIRGEGAGDGQVAAAGGGGASSRDGQNSKVPPAGARADGQSVGVAGRGRLGGPSGGRGGGRGGAGAGRPNGVLKGVSRLERQQWATADFQARVHDALLQGTLLPPTPSLGSPSALGVAAPPAAAAAAPLVTPEELDVMRWGRNASVSVPKQQSALTYKKATALEVLVAYMYLTAPDRCERLITTAITAPSVRSPPQGGLPQVDKG
ncbi:hypothetical protein TSOC_004959 [Tetrabaena socialis]|uniref:RNase III domain-containing protein n=1 Tax=Tetrabaena socialis TaxID=47790 RepID=A0A2J8A7L0_9CHLO|nr:hypothetical protein TSOC_004959 [Tetrabaena socialis]|eukprot:PNH08485.1 hypothetical protein TSOC_004959 [Tetrabaena socialis]